MRLTTSAIAVIAIFARTRATFAIIAIVRMALRIGVEVCQYARVVSRKLLNVMLVDCWGSVGDVCGNIGSFCGDCCGSVGEFLKGAVDSIGDCDCLKVIDPSLLLCLPVTNACVLFHRVARVLT